jgi:cytochrome P450
VTQSEDPDRAEGPQFDLTALEPAFYADPYPRYAEMRERSPVHRCPDGTWFLTRHSDLERVYRDRSNFSSDKRVAFAPKYGPDSPLFAHHTTSLVFNDAPYHTRVRRQIVGALTPHVLKALEPAVVSLVDRLLDGLEARGGGDLVTDFATAIPVEVIGRLLGIPPDEREPLRNWSLAILGALEPVLTSEQQAFGERSVREFLNYLAQLVADRRRAPGGDDDLLTRLIRDETGGQPLSEHELLHNCIFLLNAGHETTTHLIGNGLELLMRHRGQFERLLAQPELIQTCVEECLRCESPNQLGNRLVSAPVDIGGVGLVPGDYLTLCIGAANRDPHAFPEADRFDIARTPNPHLAFAAGAHACAGMAVARLEARIAILRASQRFPRMHVAGTPVRASRARFRGWKTLPIEVR